MSELKDKLTRNVSEIDKTISNPIEKEKVLNVIQEMISEFTSHVISLIERQNNLENKITEITDTLADIEEELVDEMAEDMKAECPYCGETIPLVFKDGKFSDFECPKCHNLIEMEMMFDEGCADCESDIGTGCQGNCSSCGFCGENPLKDSEEDEENK